MYDLRNDEGVLVARISNAHARVIINGTEGHWAPSCGVETFFIDEDMSYGDVELIQMKIFIWKGYYLKKSKVTSI